MSIRTGKGDGGNSDLIGGDRVSKDSIRLEAYGSVDELNAALSVALAAGPPPEVVVQLDVISADLFGLGADLANPACGVAGGSQAMINSETCDRLREWIDGWEKGIPPLKNFVLPGGTPASSALHLARTICRRAERRVVSLSNSEPCQPQAIVYLNRLSDLLFMHARATNLAAGVSEPPWKPER